MTTAKTAKPTFGQRLGDVLSRPLTDYIGILAVTGALTVIGMLMVLSSSMAMSVQENNSVWAIALRQFMMVFAGLVAMWIMMRIRPAHLRRLGVPMMAVAIILLVLVLIPGLGTGLEQMGSQSWLVLGPLTLQPSEVAKFTLGVWGSAFLAKRLREARDVISLFGTFIIVIALVLVLVLLERDLGMMASLAVVVVALSWFGGMPRWIVTLGSVVLALALVVFTATVGFRSTRISVYLEGLRGNFLDTQGAAYQSYQGYLSLADGGINGVGLGQSRAKWFYLPEAKNDFVFAIVGEELGFIGAMMVVLLFLMLGFFGMRIAMRSKDPFLRLLAATTTTGIVVQAFVNMGYVVGLLPVTGLQLPLISAGGTSVIITLASMGLLASCARHEPEAISAMQENGRPAFDRWLMLPEPTNALSTSAERADKPKRASGQQRFGEPVTARSSAQRRARGAMPPAAGRAGGRSTGGHSTGGHASSRSTGGAARRGTERSAYRGEQRYSPSPRCGEYNPSERRRNR